MGIDDAVIVKVITDVVSDVIGKFVYLVNIQIQRIGDERRSRIKGSKLSLAVDPDGQAGHIGHLLTEIIYIIGKRFHLKTNIQETKQIYKNCNNKD